MKEITTTILKKYDSKGELIYHEEVTVTKQTVQENPFNKLGSGVATKVSF